MKSLGTGNVTGGFVRFWLRGCAGNQPRIAGTGLIAPTLGGGYFFDMPANASGAISGTLYSNRDATGLLGGEIECGGSLTATWYGLQAYFGGKGGPEVAVYAKNGGTLDVSNVTPLSTAPVITAPTGDSTYLRLDAGNSPVTGALSLNGPVSACNLNSKKNVGGGCASFWGGGDIGAQINAAAATCVTGAQCHIWIAPAAQQAFSTPIVYVDNETVECAATGILDNTTTHNTLANLSYTGSATAVTMGRSSGRFKGCGLLLSSTTNTGILLANNGERIEDADIRGGGATTKMVNASGSVLSTSPDDVEIVNSRINAYIGIAVACDNLNDLRILNTSAVGITSNASSIMLLVDTACTGVTVSDYFGYNVGLYGLFMRKTLTGLPPQSFFFRNFECDLPTSDCFLFDSTLTSFPLHFACDDCWAAGAGGAGIHISGGSEIAFSHAQIRANSHDGVLIDGALVEAVMITSSLIGGNNLANAGFNGISIRNHPAQIVIVGNEISDSTETGGFQHYALNAYADVEGLVFSSNDCAQNVVGCANLTNVTSSKLTNFGNTNVVSGLTNEPSYFPGSVTSSTGIFAGGATINVLALATPTALPNTNATGFFGVLSVRDQTSGGVAVFILDPNNGAQLLGASNITGLAAAGVTFSSGWRISLSSGATPRALVWTIFQ
jgi:hypothetical protein